MKNRALARERQKALPIIAALAAAIAPHVPGLPPWITLWCFTMWGYMVVRLKTGWPLPSAPVRYALIFLGIAGLLATYPSGIGADAFVGLMALMAAVKPFEMPTHRHRMITILLTYFMIITSLFRSDALFTVIYMFFSVFISTVAMVRVNWPTAPFGQSRKLAATILVQALPLVALLFMAFPRLPGTLVGFQDRGQGRTGFAETMAPGQISALGLDNTPAFRVVFDAGTPPEGPLYWRGIVFPEFDGKTWRPDAHPPLPLPAPKTGRETRTEEIGYTIRLAPHNSRWLMALDRPVKGPSWAVLGKDRTLRSAKKIRKKTEYRAVSTRPEFLEPEFAPPPSLTEQILAKAGDRNPKTLALAREIAGQAANPKAKAERLLAYFREKPFVYTLKPPLAGPHPLDTFMFTTRRGYCEHFASAFAFMLNGAGVPARVVGGYLGGELNPFGNYIIVRQSYAHAWVEFFDRKWTRIDPTGVVSPDRMFTNPDGSSSGKPSASLSLFNRINFALDALNLKWESWFTGYSYLEQKAWLSALGLVRESRSTLPVLGLMAILGTALFSALMIRKFRRGSPHPIVRVMEVFYKKMERLGLRPGPGQGPKDFGEACIKKRPDLWEEIHSILDLYLSLRYKKKCPETALSELRDLVKKFNPPKHS